VHDCLFGDEYDEFWETLFKLEFYESYHPTKSVIKEYVKRRWDYDYLIPGEKEMNDFLAGYVKDEVVLDDLQGNIRHCAHRVGNASEVRADLENAGVPLDNAEFIKEFERLFNIMRSQSRIWELHGFTIREYEIKTGQKIKRFKLHASIKDGKKRRK
jgi:hypothetical protein